MDKWLLTPPIAFIIILAASWLLARLFSRLAFRSKKQAAGSRESYACGEENYDQLAQPDYSTFFPFAFFFTLAHVATLIMATVSVQTAGVFVLVAIYIVGAILGLYILFRR
jgi:NADH:ubiquinone oxidoreductase subunit 3 (subunit A)